MIGIEFNTEERKMLITRAGHPPLAFLRKNNVHWLSPSGLGLGLTNSSQFQKHLKVQEIALEDNDFIYIFTDGVVERMNASDEEFGFQRLESLLGDVDSDCTPKTFHRILKTTLEQFAENRVANDDSTSIAIRFRICAKDNLPLDSL